MGKRKNRKIVKKSSGVRFGAFVFPMIFFSAIGVALIYWVADQRGASLQRSLNEEETALKSLEEEYARECVRWDSMVKPDNLDKALLKHGLAMEKPRPEQIVRLDSAGRPKPGQTSVAWINTRRSRTAVAMRRRDGFRGGRN